MKLGLLAVLTLLLSGCHTIRPAAIADTTYLAGIPRSSHKVLLVLEEDYRGYVSHDRGNSAADPQTYMIGESLAPLTEQFFKETYFQVMTLGQMPGAADPQKWDYVIRPRVEFFNNDLGAITLQQSINVGLSADIYDGQLRSIGRVSSTGQHNGSIGVAAVVLGSTTKSGKIVSLALQDALRTLLEQSMKKTG